MERIEIGLHVDIQRSDGRVHGAVISELKKDKAVVTVEWFEKGETKGKEIDVETLLRINPTLIGNANLAQMLNQSTAFENGEDDGEETLYIPPSLRNPPSRRRTDAAPLTPTPTTRQQPAIAQPVPPPQENNRRAPKSAMPQPEAAPTSRMPAPQPVKLPQSTRGIRSSASALSPAVEPLPDPLLRSSERLDDGMDETRIIGGKSSTVQEIEKLQKNREERRAQQNQAKKQREMEKSIDPGNPNYQFLMMIRDYQTQIDYRPLKMTDAVTDQRITVCVRKRPLNKKELNRKEIEVLTIPNRDHLIVHQPQVKVDLTKYLENQKFRFDYTFDENTSNEMVYRFTAQPLVRTVFEQGFATCFAYGQTGSGKTHTMGGDFNGKNQDCSRGIYALTASDVFRLLSKDFKHEKLSVGCSFFEIYGGKVYDLLRNKALLRVLEDGNKEVQVVGLQEELVSTETEVLGLIRKGTDVRTAGTTSANTNSSRSHAVFQIILRKGKRLWGKFSLIDLAGNERGVDTAAADRQTRLEGAEINKSLLALKECIRAMSKNSNHVPFRASKLTLVLRDSFIGEKARTCMIAMISPGLSSCEHTLNTLRYADRVKELGADENGASSPMADEELMLNGGENEEADLSLVCSRNGTTKEALDVQRLMATMTQAEEDVIDGQNRYMDDLRQFLKEYSVLSRRANDPDYDQEWYISESERLLDRHLPLLDDMRDNVKKWKKAIKEEAELSSRAKSKKK